MCHLDPYDIEKTRNVLSSFFCTLINLDGYSVILIIIAVGPKPSSYAGINNRERNKKTNKK